MTDPQPGRADEVRVWGCFLCFRLSHMANRCGVYDNCGHYYVRADLPDRQEARDKELVAYFNVEMAKLHANALLKVQEARCARWREWWFAQGHRGFPPPEDLLRDGPPQHPRLVVRP